MTRWDCTLREWQKRFNDDITACGLPIFVKTQSNCWLTSAQNKKGNEEEHRHFEYWIAVSVTAEDNIALYEEPHLFGDIIHYCSWTGVDESALCSHPMI